MDIKNIRTFIRVAELKSFTKVAKEQSYVQSAVTMQIQQLEKTLGYPLFDRIGKTVSLTSGGDNFLKYAYDIIDSFEKAVALDKDNPSVFGTLRVGVLESLLVSRLKLMLPEFFKKHNNIELRVKTEHSKELLKMLKENELDLAYISTDINTDSLFKCLYKREEQLIFVCAPNHPIASKKKISPETLFGYDFAVTEKIGFCYNRLTRLAAEYNQSLKEIIEIDSTSVISELVAKGLGIALLPEYCVKESLEKGSLVKIDADIPKQIYYSQVLCHKNRWISPFIKAFVETLEETN